MHVGRFGYKTFIFECNLTGSAVVPAHVTAQLRDFGGAWTARWSVRRERLAIRGLHARAVQRSPSGYASAHRRGTSRACPCRPRAAPPDGQRLPAGHVQRLLSLCRCLFAPASTAHLKSSWSSSVARPVSSVQCTREKRESRTEPSSGESAQSTYSTEPSCFTACKGVLWLRNTTFTTPAHRGAATTWSSHSIGFRCRASRSQGKISSPDSVWLTVRSGRLLAASRETARRLGGSPSVTAYHRPAASDGRHGALTPRAVEIANGL